MIDILHLDFLLELQSAFNEAEQLSWVEGTWQTYLNSTWEKSNSEQKSQRQKSHIFEIEFFTQRQILFTWVILFSAWIGHNMRTELHLSHKYTHINTMSLR